MKPRLMEALENMRRHNAGVMSRECFGFEPDVPYDALVVATSWKPDKTVLDPSFTVTQLTQHAYFSGFLMEKEGRRIAWAQTASGACNVLDHILVCAELSFRKMSRPAMSFFFIRHPPSPCTYQEMSWGLLCLRLHSPFPYRPICLG